jgi:protein-S-isoprenylcysteine O-methyltransferase Ste14
VIERLARIAFFAGLVAEMLVRLPHERRRRGRTMTDRRVTPVEKGLFAGMSLGTFFLPVLYSATTWLDFATIRLPARWRALSVALGGLLLAAGVWLFGRAHRDLGLSWSPTLEIGAQQPLITAGVYGAVRHPMYTSQLLMGLGQALLLPNWLAGSGGLLTFLALVRLRVPPEERMMRDHFGAAYEAYAARTGAVVPRLPGSPR